MIKKLEESPFLFEPDSKLESLLNKTHPLYILAHNTDWQSFEDEFSQHYTEQQGRPCSPIRLMVALHYLKFMYDLSDEELVWRWVENPYWQYFSGEEYFQKQFPIHPTSMTKFRKRIKKKGANKLLQETIKAGLKLKMLRENSFSKVCVDTTVQEKNITFPTDGKLYYRMIETLVRESKKENLCLRQSFLRVGKRMLRSHQRYAHSRKMKKAQSCLRKLKTYLGRLTRDIERKSSKRIPKVNELIEKSFRLLSQQRNDKNKIYSIHADEVECISKGKAGKRYEFGCKVSVCSTLKEGFILSTDALHGNPYDGHTLQTTLDQTKENIGKSPEYCLTDKGYRGHGYKGNTKVICRGVHKLKNPYQKRWVKRQSLIEAVIGHMKNDSRMDRNFLSGKLGDQMNAILSAAGQNLRKVMKFIIFCFFISSFPRRNFFYFGNEYPKIKLAF